MENASATRMNYIPAVDGLRAVAVSAVMIFHLGAFLLPGGFTGVDVFFVISGFVVTGSMAGRRFDTLGGLLIFFYARRLLRIMPALLVMLLVAATAQQLFVPDAWLSDTVQRTAKWAFVGASNIVLAQNGDTYFSPRAAYNTFTHTWSLGVEEQFYVVFPFIMYWHQRRAGGGSTPPSRGAVEILVASLALASLIACAVLAQIEHRYAFYLIPARFWELGSGMLLALTRDTWRTRIAGWTAGQRATLIAGSVTLLVVAFALPETTWFPFPLALLPVAGSAGLIAVADALPTSPVSRILSARLPVAVGRWSYSLYLWHWPVFVLFRWTVGLDSVAHAGLALALSVALGWLSFRFVERPTRSSTRIAGQPRWRVVVASLAVVALSAVSGVMLFRAHDRITLSRTGDHRAWYADDKRPLPAGLAACAPIKATAPIADGLIATYRPQACAPPASGRLFAIGDSHNAAYAPLYRALAADAGVEARMYTRTNCGFLRLQRPMLVPGECLAWTDASLTSLRRALRPGDVLFLPSLRLFRLAEEDSVLPPRSPAALAGDAADRAAAVPEARILLRQLTDTGATIVFEAPNPIFRAPAFRCSDWFNHHNPVCRAGFAMRRADEEAIRRPILDAMRGAAAGLPNVRIWDPFSILCPEATCRAVRDGQPIFFDADHVSGHANDLLYPSFRAAILAAMLPRPHHPLRPD